MFRSASFFICTSFKVAVFTIFANIKCRLHCRYSPQNIFNANFFNPHKKPIFLLNVPICTQGMQRTWWPEAGTTLKRKCLHFGEIFITGCTESCQNDNFQCSQWWKFRQNDDIFVSVLPESILLQFYVACGGARPQWDIDCNNSNALVFKARWCCPKSYNQWECTLHL